ncbi:unnamed protein product [Boreogadus saida]
MTPNTSNDGRKGAETGSVGSHKGGVAGRVSTAKSSGVTRDVAYPIRPHSVTLRCVAHRLDGSAPKCNDSCGFTINTSFRAVPDGARLTTRTERLDGGGKEIGGRATGDIPDHSIIPSLLENSEYT